mgnify:CR=1 FL=1
MSKKITLLGSTGPSAPRVWMSSALKYEVYGLSATAM